MSVMEKLNSKLEGSGYKVAIKELPFTSIVNINPTESEWRYAKNSKALFVLFEYPKGDIVATGSTITYLLEDIKSEMGTRFINKYGLTNGL